MNALTREADYFHRELFGEAAPQDVALQYAAACEQVLRPDSTAWPVDTAAIVERRLDAEAIELYLRRRHGPNRLTQKFRILFYLIEIRPEHYGRFVGRRPARVAAWFGLALGGLRSAWLLAKGGLLCRIHRVA